MVFEDAREFNLIIFDNVVGNIHAAHWTTGASMMQMQCGSVVSVSVDFVTCTHVRLVMFAVAPDEVMRCPCRG